MGTQFRMDSVPGSLIVVGGTYEPWLSVLEQVGGDVLSVRTCAKRICCLLKQGHVLVLSI